MSIYNENEEELKKSIFSILNQSYKNIDLIIVNDNPKSQINRSLLASLNDSRVKIINNSDNLGIVGSLNKALEKCRGSFVARMDADDISHLNRINIQLNYLKNNNLDLVGSWIELIDNKDVIFDKMVFPVSSKFINASMKYGGCVPHPTWLAKKEVFKNLKGYRTIPNCEDYDFLLRALKNGFKIGNVPLYLLKYRVRPNGISSKNKIQQIVLRRFLSKNFNNISDLSEQQVAEYMKTNEYNDCISDLSIYENIKQLYKNKHSLRSLARIMTNKEFYRYITEKGIVKTILKIDNAC